MAQPRIQCCWKGCRKARKVDRAKWSVYQAECDNLGVRPGLLCPAHFAAAIEAEDRYEIDLSPGEVLVELAKTTPQWRLVYLPPDRPQL